MTDIVIKLRAALVEEEPVKVLIELSVSRPIP